MCNRLDNLVPAFLIGHFVKIAEQGLPAQMLTPPEAFPSSSALSCLLVTKGAAYHASDETVLIITFKYDHRNQTLGLVELAYIVAASTPSAPSLHEGIGRHHTAR